MFQVAYYGDPKGVVDHFAAIGLQCAPQYNPADFVCGYDIVKETLLSATLKLFQSNHTCNTDYVFVCPVEAVRMGPEVKKKIYQAAASLRHT